MNDLLFTRCWWTADVRRGNGHVWLLPRPGARHQSFWRSTLELFNARIEPAEQLRAHVGDQFVACGVGDDEVAMATVLGVGSSGELRVELKHGVIVADVVQLLDANGLRSKRKRRSKAVA